MKKEEADEAEVSESDKLLKTFAYLLKECPAGRTAVVLMHEDYPLELPTFGPAIAAAGVQKGLDTKVRAQQADDAAVYSSIPSCHTKTAEKNDSWAYNRLQHLTNQRVLIRKILSGPPASHTATHT
eukprot:1178225-Prorocentrum_minimum.AAC.2